MRVWLISKRGKQNRRVVAMVSPSKVGHKTACRVYVARRNTLKHLLIVLDERWWEVYLLLKSFGGHATPPGECRPNEALTAAVQAALLCATNQIQEGI